MFYNYENRDRIVVELPTTLYLELMDCEVESPIDGLSNSHNQFVKSMLKAEEVNEVWETELDEDGFTYLLNIALPTYMEMWYSWGDDLGEKLLNEAKSVLDNFDVYYPY